MSLVGCALLEEQQVGADRGVGLEHGVGQADDGVEVALLHQMFLEPRLDALAEQRAVRQHHGGAPARLQQADDQGEEQVGGLAGAEVVGKVVLDAVFLAPAERRIGEHDVDAVALRVADVGPRQRVVVAHEARVLDAVQQHVGDAQHVRQLLLLDGAQGAPASSPRPRASSRSASRMWRMAQVRKPPVPQAGSSRISPGLGSMRSAMKAVTARGV